MTEPDNTILYELADYLTRYVVFPQPDDAHAVALWIAATHLWTEFDAFPYLCITSETKRSGKTRLSELLSFTCPNALSVTGVSAAGIFQCIQAEKPVLIVDEAEILASDKDGTMRSVLNSGYRKGNSILRGSLEGTPIRFDVYCPKVFVLIGDVNDTLRDRCILLRLSRSHHVPERFLYGIAQQEGNTLRERLAEWMIERKAAILDQYANHGDWSFLQDREEEIWRPLIAISEATVPKDHDTLVRMAVDLSSAKTAPIRRYTNLGDAEEQALQSEYGELLIEHATIIFKDTNASFLALSELVDRLLERPEFPWRQYKGEPLTVRTAGNLLSPFGLRAKQTKHKGKNQRGFQKSAFANALKKLTPPE